MKKLVLSLLLFPVLAFGQITNVFLGTAPNDGTGDAPRPAYIKLNANDNYLALNFTNLSASNTVQIATNVIFSNLFANLTLSNTVLIATNVILSNLVVNLQATNVIFSNLVYNLQATNVVLSNEIYSLHVNGIASTWTNLVSGVITQRLVTVGGILVSNETISY